MVISSGDGFLITRLFQDEMYLKKLNFKNKQKGV